MATVMETVPPVDLPYLGHHRTRGLECSHLRRAQGHFRDSEALDGSPLFLWPQLSQTLIWDLAPGRAAWRGRKNLASQTSGEPVLYATMYLMSFPLRASVFPSVRWERGFEFIVTDESIFQF